MDHSPDLKVLLHAHCLNVLNERIREAGDALEDVRTSLLPATKSTAGDQHDTARALARIELEKQQAVLQHLSMMRNTLTSMDPREHHETVEPGALISTDLGAFYIAISLGKVMLGDTPVWVISPQAPLFQVLKDTPIGEIAFFNGQAYRMHRVA